MQFWLQTPAKKFCGSAFPLVWSAGENNYVGCAGRTQVRWMLLDFTSLWTLTHLDGIAHWGGLRSSAKQCCFYYKIVRVVNVCSRCCFLWCYTQTTASDSEWVRCFVPCCPVHDELASIVSILTVGPMFCDGITKLPSCGAKCQVFFFKKSRRCCSSFQVNLLGCRCVREEFSLHVLSYGVSSSLSGPVCVAQKEALSCRVSLSCWERRCSAGKAVSHMKASVKALFGFLSER